MIELTINFCVESVGSFSSFLLFVPIVDILPKDVELFPQFISFFAKILACWHYRINIKTNSIEIIHQTYFLESKVILYVVFMGVPSISSISGSNSSNFILYPGYLVISLPNKDIVVSFGLLFRFNSSAYSSILFALR